MESQRQEQIRAYVAKTRGEEVGSDVAEYTLALLPVQLRKGQVSVMLVQALGTAVEAHVATELEAIRAEARRRWSWTLWVIFLGHVVAGFTGWVLQ